MALLIFALAAAVLGAAYVNVLNTYDVAARGTVVNEDFAFARQRVLTEPHRKKVEEGGEFDTVGGRHAHWTAEIASTGMPDLFEVNFSCEITDPQVREPAAALLGGLPNVRLLPPLDYDEMIHLLDRCRFVITDSGGLIEEAPGFSKPALIVRQTTERQEAVVCGGAALCGYDGDRLLELAETLLRDSALYRTMAAAPNPFGDGRAAQRIAQALADAVREGQLSPAEFAVQGRAS